MNLPSCENPFQIDRLNDSGNFCHEWDVPAIGATVSAALDRDIDAVREQDKPSPDLKIHVLVGASGYGKPHLFGRLAHRQQERVLLLFVPSPSAAGRPVANIQWYLIETLFQPAADGLPPLNRILARLLQPSLAAYFSQLPPPLQARYQSLHQRVREDWHTVLEICAAVTELTPFQILADSLHKKFPQCRSDVLRALILGLSPAASEARCWLRGEELQPERCRQLRLSELHPEPSETLLAVVSLLQTVGTPLVLCLDQLEALLLKNAEAFRLLTTELMNWLQTVPNLVIVVSCLEANCKLMRDSFQGFYQRVLPHPLAQLSAAEAVELVTRRLQSWDDRDSSQAKGWPFDLDSIKRFVERQPVPPRGFIQLCAKHFDHWQASKSTDCIVLGKLDETVPLSSLFMQEWNQQLQCILKSAKPAVNFQEAEIWQGVHEALQIARLGAILPQGVVFERIQEKALEASAQDERPSAELHLLAGAKRLGVVVAVTKKDEGQAFGRYITALQKALGGHVVGGVVVWPKSQFGVGPKTMSYTLYKKLTGSGQVRPFLLDEEEATFAQLECLRQFIKRAEAKDLVLGGAAVTVDELRTLIVETKVLHNLKLYNFIFHDWPAFKVGSGIKPAPLANVVAAQAKVHSTVAVGAAEAVIPTNTSEQAAPSPPSPPKGGMAPQSPKGLALPPSAPTWPEELLQKVVDKLRNWGQSVRARAVEVGPTFVRLKVEPRDQTDFGKVRRQAENLKLHLSLESRPIIASQPGYISIDVKRPDRQMVSLPSLLQNRPAHLLDQPAFLVGVDVAGHSHWLNLADPSTCHLLIAGTTGSGKSVFMQSLIGGLAGGLGPDRLRLILIDPKRVTFNFRGDSPYLLAPVAYDINDALPLIEKCFAEMEGRYALLQQRHKEHIGELAGADSVPRWVVVFDEFADLMLEKASKKELETLLKRLGAKARAAGIHLVLSTQRTEASVVTPLLRSNLPGRISLQVISERDSKLILESPEAADLLGKGDLFWRYGGGLLRLQSPLATTEQLASLLRLH